MRAKTFSLILAALLAPTAVYSCQFDVDCAVGSKCLKQSGHLEGVCVGGMNPGNANDQNPYRNQLDINRTEGNTCSFDTDCGVGARCMKGAGQIYGVCMRR